MPQLSIPDLNLLNPDIPVAVILLLVLSTLAILLWNWKVRSDTGARRSRKSRDEKSEVQRPGSLCPLCNAFLPRGVRVHSVVFPGREFDLMRIYGCPNCRVPQDGSTDSGARPRRCPCCGEVVSPDGYVMARVYHKPYRKIHVNVYGCTVCRPGRG